MASALSSQGQQDFSGGENPVANPFQITPSQVVSMTNMILDEHGSLRVRDGTLIQQPRSPRGSTYHQIVKIFDLQEQNLTVVPTAILLGSGVAGDAPQWNALYKRSGSSWTLIGNFQEVYATPDIIQFLYKLIIAAGPNETPWIYDGSTFTQVTVQSGQNLPPGASHVAVHKSYVWLWNTSQTDNSFSGASSLQSSDVNSVVSWPASNQIFVNQGDGQQGTGMGQFTIAEAGISPDSTLVLFKQYATYQVNGVFGASNFSVQRVKTDMGCIAARTVQFVPGFGIIRLSHRGFALFDGVNDTLISEEERPRIFGRDQYPGLDFTNISKSMAAQLPNPPLYICACPVAGQEGLPVVFVFDLVRRSWGTLQFNNTISTMQQILDANQIPFILSGDATRGYIRQMFNGALDDDGVDVNWTVQFRPITSQTVNDRFFFRRFLIDTFDMKQVNISASFMWPEGSYGKTLQTPDVAPGYGLGGWGTSPYGSVSSSPSTTAFDLLGGAITNVMNVGIAGTGGCLGRIRGVTWHTRKKPLTRSQSGLW